MMFVFQACYGTPQDFGHDILIEGVVKAKKTDKPIAGIKVSVQNQPQYVYSDSNGKFGMYTQRENSYKLLFSDPDGPTNGTFLEKDTTIVAVGESIMFLNISLNEK
jgi:hypothetical protein